MSDQHKFRYLLPPGNNFHFVSKFNARLGKQIEDLSGEALAALSSYAWPGNVRELENVMERAALFADGATISLEHLPEEVTSSAGQPSERGATAPDVGLKEQVRAAVSQLERQLILRALEQMGGNVTHTARLLKLSRKGLQLKMKELGLRDLPLRPQGSDSGE